MLTLFVTGNTARTTQAIANLRRLCEEDLAGALDFEVIDVLEQPDRAEGERILATPTLVKAFPPPVRRIIGDLSDRNRVLEALDLQIEPGEADEEKESGI